MKVINKHLALSGLFVAAAVACADAAAVRVNINSIGGVAGPGQTLTTSGVARIGFFPGLDTSQVTAISGNVGDLDAAFTEVVQSTTFNNLGGHPGFFNGTAFPDVVADGDGAGLATYQSNVAGNQLYVFLQDGASYGLITSSNTVPGVGLFNTASDPGGADFNTNFTIGESQPGILPIVGSFEDVVAGGAIDNLGGGAGTGPFNQPRVFGLVPEPSHALLIALSAVGFLVIGRRRHG